MGALKERYQARDAAGRERRSAAELRRKIARHAKGLSQKLLRPSDKKHVPENLRGPVAALLESINQESQYTIDPETGSRRKGGGACPPSAPRHSGRSRSSTRPSRRGPRTLPEWSTPRWRTT